MGSALNGSSSMLEEELREIVKPNKFYKISLTKMRELSSYLGFIVPLLLSVYYAWTKSQRHLLDHVVKHFHSTTAAIISNRASFNIGHSSGNVLQISSEKFDVLLRVMRSPSIGSELNLTAAEPTVHCQVLHDPGPDMRVADIIFIHGLKGAVEKTWTQAESSGEFYTKCWPRDWLPVDCPKVRVIAINYTTDPYLWRPFWMSGTTRTPMLERSWEMINNLIDIGVGQHSIVWVGHSKGGLYVKQVLVNACETLEDKYKELSKKTKGVLFYSVPHRGSPLANLNLPLIFRQSIELIEVQKDCTDVLTLHEKFKQLIDTEQLKLNVKSFIETQLTLMSFIYVRIVSQESADVEVGETYDVPLDHRNICKPRSRECFLYQEVVTLIKNICGEVPM